MKDWMNMDSQTDVRVTMTSISNVRWTHLKSIMLMTTFALRAGKVQWEVFTAGVRPLDESGPLPLWAGEVAVFPIN
jgi:hypothetical protein